MEYVHYPSVPQFDVEKQGGKKKVWLLCSYCKKKVRVMRRREKIRVDIGHYCDECDPGEEIPNKGGKIEAG